MIASPAFAAPLRIGGLTLRNRFVSAPMERNYGTRDGLMTEQYTAYLRRRAAGGAALVFTEATYVRADGKGRIRQLGADDDRCLPGLARAAQVVHAAGALFGVELNHGGRTAQGTVSGFRPVAPSPVPCAVAGGELPAQLDAEDIEHLIECYGEAAARCAEAGVDAVSLHGGHGYLIHQFLSPAYNRRDDEWAEPTRFLDAVIDSVRRHAPGIVLGLRLSAFEGTEDGLDAATTGDVIARSAAASLDFLDVSAGNYEAGQWIVQPGEWPRAVLAAHARAYTEAYNIPVGVAGRISTPEAAHEAIASGAADFVSMARTLHADPDFPRRALDGGAYRPCIACNHCIDSLAAGPVPCSVNPWVGRENDEPTDTGGAPARVAVIGGGPAGLAAARESARLGHRVELFDERPKLGGDFALAARLPGYPEYARIVDWHLAELNRLRVPCHTGTRIDAAALGVEWDAIVLATGGRGPAMPLPGGRPTRDVRDYLRADPPPPAAITIYGADREAAALADTLLRAGTAVTLIGPQPAIAPDVGRRGKIVLVPRLLAATGLTWQSASVIVRAEPGRALIRPIDAAAPRRWVDAPGELLISRGIEPRNGLLPSLRALKPRLGVYAVGDAGGDGGSVHAAITTGTDAAVAIHRAASHRICAPPSTGAHR
jgi:2,4-dienoyl-CoA reductase-like NADH-dependent reductase (Old Yellow Enzyme family)